MMQLLAHKDQSLDSHLEGVCQRAAKFAAAFDASEQGAIAGLLHDLDKVETEFQDHVYL